MNDGVVPEVSGISEAPEPVSVYDPATDPLAEFISSIRSGTPDLAKRHDVYLAETSADDHSR